MWQMSRCSILFQLLVPGGCGRVFMPLRCRSHGSIPTEKGEHCWKSTLRKYSVGVAPPKVWNDGFQIDIDDVPLIPLIRT